MKSQQCFAVCFCLFAMAGSYSRLCEAAPSDPKLLSTNGEFLLQTVHENDSQVKVAKLRVVRYVPHDDTNQGPSAEQMAIAQAEAAANRDRQQREKAQRERTRIAQENASAALAEEERDRERGNAELWERYNRAQDKKKPTQRPSTRDPTRKVKKL